MITASGVVQQTLGIYNQDALIDILIPMVEEEYLSIRNIPFEINSSGILVYPIGSELTAIRMISYQIQSLKSQGVHSESLGDYSVTYDTVDHQYPRSIIGSIKRYAEII